MARLEQVRRAVTDRLGTAYAEDQLELEQLEQRLDRAERATDIEALRQLVADLPAPEPEGAQQALVQRQGALDRSAAGETALVPAEAVPERSSVVTIFGSAQRERDWIVPRRLRVVSVFGGTRLDLRQARLAPGTTEIRVVSVMAGVELLVPPGLEVEVAGHGVLGAFEHQRGVETPSDQAPCRVRVSGVAVLGGVEVEQRRPGESARQARRRRRREHRALRGAQTDRLLREHRAADKHHVADEHRVADEHHVADEHRGAAER